MQEKRNDLPSADNAASGAPISASFQRGIDIIARHGYDLTPTYFAKLMWPESPAWKRAARAGHGTHIGGGMSTAGGAFLGRLKKAGVIGEYTTKDGRRRFYVTKGESHP